MAYLSNVFTFWNFGRTSLYNVTIMVSFIYLQKNFWFDAIGAWVATFNPD